MAVKFGVFVPQGWRMDLAEIADPVEQFEAMTNVARVADEGGWDSIWVYDHFHTVPTPEIETTFECWSITATLARDTRRVRIGQMVGCNGYRNPALYAKIASTVDVASHGRINAGIGAGWHEHEWRAYGYQWDDTPVRMAKFREAVEIVHKMWTEEKPVFHGTYYAIDGPINEPKGAQKPHIPLWIGGGGEKVTLKLVAKWGDACNVGGGNPDVCRQKLAVLQRHCGEQGRDFAEIIKSTSLMICLVENEANAEQETAKARGKAPFEEFSRSYLVGSVDTIARRIEDLVAVGIDYVIVNTPRLAYDQTPMRRFVGEVIPKFS
ncbi:MAG TPA: LLM class F420-dependent oxidoreductase [Thermomicrobiales bacterium]|jgi:F420-dependent oxidoreductase-like protein